MGLQIRRVVRSIRAGRSHVRDPSGVDGRGGATGHRHRRPIHRSRRLAVIMRLPSAPADRTLTPDVRQKGRRDAADQDSWRGLRSRQGRHPSPPATTIVSGPTPCRGLLRPRQLPSERGFPPMISRPVSSPPSRAGTVECTAPPQGERFTVESRRPRYWPRRARQRVWCCRIPSRCRMNHEE